jgi:hypothetical protein
VFRMNTFSKSDSLPVGLMIDRNIWATIILWLCGVILGLGYLVLPKYIYFLTVIIALVFVVGFLKPEYTFYLMFLIIVEEMIHIFITIAPIFQVRYFPYQIPLLATIIGLIAHSFLRLREINRTPLDIVIWLLWGMEMVSILWAPNVEVAMHHFFFLTTNLMLYYAIVTIIENEAILKKLIKVWIFAGVASSLGVILSQWIDLGELISFSKTSGISLRFGLHADRPAGVAGTDHVAGFMSTAGFMVLASMAWDKRTKVRILYTMILLFLLVGIILTRSRGVLFGFVGGYFFFLFIHSDLRKNFLKFSAIGLVVLSITILLTAPGFIDRILIGFGYTGKLYLTDGNSYYQGTEAATELGEGLSGLEIRYVWMVNGLREMVDHPLKIIFGLGISGFIYYSGGHNTVTSPEANNSFLAFFYDLGLFGVILLIVLIHILLKNFIYFIKVTDRRSYVFYMLIGSTTAMIAETGIHGLVDYDLTSYGSKYVWMPLAVTMAIMNILKTEIAKGDQKA